MLQINRERKFKILVDNANRCNLCMRMHGRTRVLSEKNGDIYSKVVFVGEAPGRLGADRTGVPFYGDKAGQNFERLLIAAGLTRREIFITNAVLCNPRDDKGNNAVPTKEEVRNCSLHLSILLASSNNPADVLFCSKDRSNKPNWPPTYLLCLISPSSRPQLHITKAGRILFPALIGYEITAFFS